MNERTETIMRTLYARLLISGALFAAVLAFSASAGQHGDGQSAAASHHVGAAQ
jgi:hypothetical protein